MADLEAFLAEINEKDTVLKQVSAAPKAVPLPPVRGSGTAATSSVKVTGAKTGSAVPAKKTAQGARTTVKDAGAIFEDDDLSSAPPPSNESHKKSDKTKGKRYLGAYEYFSEWDKYDVDRELGKLEQSANSEGTAAQGQVDVDEGLPPGITAEMLEAMPRVEVRARPGEEYRSSHA
eukprot:6190886-Pleurochrysis_carterae.AAC.1